MVQVFIASELKYQDRNVGAGGKLRKRRIKHHHATEIVLYSAKMRYVLSNVIIIRKILDDLYNNDCCDIFLSINLWLFKNFTIKNTTCFLQYVTFSFIFLSKSLCAAKIFFPFSFNSLTRGKFPTEPHERENENNKKFIRMSQYVASCLIRD